MNQRKREGGTLVLVIACIFVTIIVGVGIFFLTRIMGGERELRNSVDAGNLNVAKVALSKRVNLPGGVGAVQFAGLGPTDTTIDLNTFNRASAMTVLVIANSREMNAAGTALPTAATHATEVQQAWETLATSLAQSLNQQTTFSSTNDFTTVAQKNTARMMKKDAVNDVDHNNHKTSYTDRGNNSPQPADGAANTYFVAGQLLSEPQNSGNVLMSNGSMRYPKGYLQFKYDSSNPVFFVPLKNSGGNFSNYNVSQPHSISTKTFTDDALTGSSGAINGWSTPVPNAFLSRGTSQDTHVNRNSIVDAAAVAQSTTPPAGWQAQMPNGFIRILNDNCTSGGNIPGGGPDIHSFLMNNPIYQGLPEGSTPLQAYYDIHGGTDLDAIIAANKDNPPRTPDCSQLKPVPNTNDCKLIKNKSGPITNNSALTGAELSYISQSLGLSLGGGSPVPVSGCLHAAELANQDFLAQRATGAAQVTLIGAYVSGIANINRGRGAFASCGDLSFTSPITMAQAIPSGSSLRAGIAARCKQMLPNFSGNLSDIQGWDSVGVPMGSRAYIYFMGNVNRNTGAVTGNLVLAPFSGTPQWLQAIEAGAGVPADGSASLHRVNTLILANTGPFNHAGDCSYPLPYDFYYGNAASMCVRDKINFVPCTGFRGLLAEIFMICCFGNHQCGGADSVTEGAGPADGATPACQWDSDSYFEGPC